MDSGIHDTCYYMEANPGDKGNHNPSFFWASQDIVLVGPVSGSDKADPGMPNPITVHVHKRVAPDPAGCPPVQVLQKLDIDVFEAFPFLAGIPPAPGGPQSNCSTARLTLVPSNFSVIDLSPGGDFNPDTPPISGRLTATNIFIWNVPSPPPPPPPGCPAGTPPPEGSGHRCLVVRVYPHGDTPDGNAFHPVDDPHYAWRNICIVPCNTGPGLQMGTGAGESGAGGRNAAGRATDGCTFDIMTTNVNNANEQAVIRVVRDPNPAQQVLNAILPELQSVPGFRTISDKLQPQGFGLQLPDFPNAVIKDNSRLGCLGLLFYYLTLLLGLLGIKINPMLATPKYEAQIGMQPNQSTLFTFATDLSNVARGEAYVYHLTHVGSDQSVKGGLTLAMVAV